MTVHIESCPGLIRVGLGALLVLLLGAASGSLFLVGVLAVVWKCVLAMVRYVL
jgi:hypothetical protein